MKMSVIPAGLILKGPSTANKGFKKLKMQWLQT
jgi:hypothetical protein